MRQEAGKLAAGSLLLIAAIATALLVVLASGAFDTSTASAGEDEESTPTEEETTPEEEESPAEDEATPDSADDSTEPGSDDMTPEGGTEKDGGADRGARGGKEDCPEREGQGQSEADPTTA